MEGVELSLIFTCGALKLGYADQSLMQDLISHNDALLIGPYGTRFSHPLVLGPHGIPYLINLPGSGDPVEGELYGVTARGLPRADHLAGTSFGHYDRLPVQVEAEGETRDGVVSVDAEAYFAHRSFGRRLWER